jgi:mannose-6-phosphate isomerase-like protein (cupin superfamily)
MLDLSISWPGNKDNPLPNGNGDKPVLTIATAESSKVLRAFGDELTVLLAGADTGGKLAMCLDVTPPQSGPPPHYHLHEDEWFFPLEGEVEFFIEGAWRAVAVGTAVFIPRGTVHTFRNSGTAPLKMLIQTTPAGFETFFARCAEEFATSDPADMARIVEISAEHGIYYVMD